MFHQGLQLLVIHTVDLVGADFLRAGERLVLGHRGGFDKFPVLPVAALGGDFADVDLGIEIRGEGAAVVAAVHIDDVERVDLIEMVFKRPRGENVRHTRIEAGAEEGGESGFLEFFLIRPLPGILEFRDIERLVVRGVHVVDPGLEAGVHEVEILVGEGDVDQQFRAGFFDQRGGFVGVVGIDLGGGDLLAGALFHRGSDVIAFGKGAGGEGDFAESFREHCAFVGDDAADPAGSDDEDFVHGESLRAGRAAWQVFRGEFHSSSPKPQKIRDSTGGSAGSGAL